jgi:hypothetical protein
MALKIISAFYGTTIAAQMSPHESKLLWQTETTMFQSTTSHWAVILTLGP